MLTQTQFSKDAEVARKLLSSAKKIIDSICEAIRNGDKETAMKLSVEYEAVSEKIVNNARLMPIATGNPNIREEVDNNILNECDVEVKYLNDGSWFYVKIPALLPKKEKGNPSFIRATLQTALKRYFCSHPKKKIVENSVIVFKHNYSKLRKEREYRDHDNIELNSIVDLIALYVLIDDTPLRLRHYYMSSVSDTDNTEIYIIPNKDFIYWLEQNESSH